MPPELLPGAGDQRAEHHRGRARVVERGVRRGHVEAKLLHQAGEAGRLALRQIENESSQRGGVDDRMLERAFQSAADEPRVEGVVAVLDQHRALGEAEERPPGIPELWCSDQHRAVDVVSLACVGIDGRAAVDERVEKRERALEGESLGADLEDEERRVARRLHVERHELRVVELRPEGDLGRVDGDLLPRDRLGRPSRLQKQPARRRAHLVSANARRAHAISSPLTARSSRIATP
jgi:hypothetical protein